MSLNSQASTPSVALSDATDQGSGQIRGASVLLGIVLFLVLLQLGAFITQVVAGIRVDTTSDVVVADPTSDAVSATAAEFRVDEAGAATYSIGLYGVPGTAGVSPKVSLSYSSQGGYGPLGKGWAISGISSITRCRASREAGDFISGGVAIDDPAPKPINFSASDKFCLDSQRLIAVSNTPACATAPGMQTPLQFRTEIENFQRICAYVPMSAPANGPAFFTVERKDGSISWYGDRDNNVTASANRPDGYVETNSALNPAAALMWAQTRFQDSTGNYIDFTYLENPAGANTGEHLISEIRYTGKNVLAGQTGAASSPFAKFTFNYSARPAAQWSTNYASGGVLTQSRRLDSITACSKGLAGACAVVDQVRNYRLTYATSISGSSQDTLTSLKECRDTGASAVCMAPTTFAWSQAKYELATAEAPTNLPITAAALRGFKLADINGDGRQDFVYLRDGSINCATDFIVVHLAVLDAQGIATFGNTGSTLCLPATIQARGDGAWNLADFDGDSRDDLYVAGPAGQAWQVYRSNGAGFDTTTNLIATTPIPSQTDKKDQAQLADLNGDGLMDLVYPNNGLKARLMERQGATFGLGAERTVVLDPNSLGGWDSRCSQQNYSCNRYLKGAPTPKTGFTQLADFNGDAASDLLIQVVNEVIDESVCIPPPCPGCQPYLGDTESRGTGTATDPQFLSADQDQSITSALVGCGSGSSVSVNLHALTVQALDATTVTLGSYAAISGDPAALSFADANGDGLTDLFYRATSSSGWTYTINTGNGMQAQVALPTSSYEDFTRFTDVNGDGRADVLQLVNDGAYKSYHVLLAKTTGGFAPLTTLSGASAKLCDGSGCNQLLKTPLFGDFDGDGVLDFMSIKLADNADMYVSRANIRFMPRDVIIQVTNGFGAQTDLQYLPLTNGALYRRDSGTRNVTSTWGRGAPVLDVLTPTYVVARVQSSAPVSGAPTAKSTLYYRYAGAKFQAGGRGYLGYDTIDTIDPNEVGGYVVTTSLYQQNFPFIGLPQQTIKRAVTGTYVPLACLTSTITDSCFSTPGIAHASLGGSDFSNNVQDWESDTDIGATTVVFASGSQLPVQVRTATGTDTLRDPFNSTVTSSVQTTFVYGAYGNVVSTGVNTYTGGGTLVSTLLTANDYLADNATKWRLGRLTTSTVTHRRPGKSDVVRATSFTYDFGTAATGLLTSERTQAGGLASQDLTKAYTLDEYGNRTRVTTCAAPATPCDASSLLFHPASAAAVKRTGHVLYDAAHRFPVGNWELFWDGSGATDREVQHVTSRDVFGNVTQANDVNGVTSLATAGSFGQPYYTWTQTVAGATLGDPAGGIDSTTTSRLCTQVSCPQGAVFRQKVVTDGSPTQWTYLDVLGRPILKAMESFNLGIANSDVAATCSDYNAAGKSVRISNPFFLPGTGGSDGPTIPSNVCTTGRDWTTTTYDLLGRPTRVLAPDGAYVDTTYVGLVTTTIDHRRAGTPLQTTQTRNAVGEVTQIVDPVGLVLSNDYDAAGNIVTVHRNAGRGDIQNNFVYDALGRKLQQFDPDSGHTTFTYNALGEVLSQEDDATQRIENAYDARGRVWQRTVKLGNGLTESQSTFNFDTASNGIGQVADEGITGTYATWQGTPSLALQFSRTAQYDALGRPLSSSTTIDGVSYPVATQYDPLGRAYKLLDASGQWSKTEYHPRGFPAAVCFSSLSDTTATCGATAWQRTQTMDAWAHVTSEVRSASGQLPVTRTYNALTGRNESICADKPGSGGACDLVDEAYAWDGAGNLSTQRKEGRYLETFTYDSLQRLNYGYANAPLGQPSKLSYFAQFDALGNVCAKSQNTANGQNYTYAGRAGCGLGNTANSGYGFVNTDLISSPHQVLSAGGYTFSYDAHGNQTVKDAVGSANDRTIRYSVDDKAYAMLKGDTTSPSLVVRFWYGPDGQRYKSEDVNGRRTLYLGNVEIVTESAVTTTKRYVGDFLLQTIVNAVASNQFTFHDQLGSLVRITDPLGVQISQMDFVPSGERRNFTDPSIYNGTAPALTTRGFSNHEAIDSLGLVHMNGRIYDPTQGRFLQADPMIQTPGDAQNWNAYTYVFNNPLAYTDPTGMMSTRQIVALVVIVAAAIISQQYWMIGNYLAAISVAAAGGFISGYVATGTLRGGVYGAFASVVTLGVGNAFSGWAQVGANAVTGGVMESLQGGSFGNGFAAAGLTAAVMPEVVHIDNDVSRTVTGALVGGTISEATGGKFANGAISGAIQGAMAGRSRREKPALEGEGNGSPLSKDDAIAAMKKGVSIFRRMRADGVMDGMDLYDDIDAVNTAHPGSFTFHYSGIRKFTPQGEVYAETDIFEYTGIEVRRIDSVDSFMETAFHEVAHLDARLDKLWRQSTPGFGGRMESYPDLRLQLQIHAEIDSSVNRLMDVYRAKYKP